jgi:hypothetical protein
MPLVGFEPTIAVLELAKTVHASDLAVTVIGSNAYTQIKNKLFNYFIFNVCS